MKGNRYKKWERGKEKIKGGKRRNFIKWRIQKWGTDEKNCYILCYERKEKL